MIDDGGAIVARYDKIHMFDAVLPDGESFCESAAFRAGQQAVIADTPWGGMGMSICYDLRFPALYHALASGGADILLVPAAFTHVTGKAHWQVLNRARAIETGCFVLAANQCGCHQDGRQTYGHSLAVDPWGEVLAMGGDDPGIVYAEPDLAQVHKVRTMVPALSSVRRFARPAPVSQSVKGAQLDVAS